jgi:hypothetical protein
MLDVRDDPFRFHRFLKLGIWCYKLTERAAKYIVASFQKAGFHPERVSSKDSLYQLKSYDVIIGFHGPLEEGEEDYLAKRMKAMSRYPLPLISLSAMKGCLNDNDVLELKKIVFRLSLLEKVTLLGYQRDAKGAFDEGKNFAYLAALKGQIEKQGFRVENEIEGKESFVFDEAKLKRIWTASLVFAFANASEFQKLYAFYQNADSCFKRFRRAGYFYYTGVGAVPAEVSASKAPLWNAHHLELSLLAIMRPQADE